MTKDQEDQYAADFLATYRYMFADALMAYSAKWSVATEDGTDNDLVASTKGQASALLASLQHRFSMYNMDDDTKESKEEKVIANDAPEDTDVGGHRDDHDNEFVEEHDRHDDELDDDLCDVDSDDEDDVVPKAKKARVAPKCTADGYVATCKCRQPWPALSVKAQAAIKRIYTNERTMDSLLCLYKHTQLNRSVNQFTSPDRSS